MRALVVGSGYRARNAFLPALSLLDQVEIVGVHSRSVEHARAAAQPYGVPVVERLESVAPGDVDLVAVSVTAVNDISVLEKLSHLAPGAALVMDTPAIGRLGDLRRLDLYRRWAHVRVAEDFMNLPQYRLVGDVIRAGHFGEVTLVRQTTMGYEYHALALARSWMGLAVPGWARSSGERVGYRFASGRAEVIGPYRQGEVSFFVEGSKGTLEGHPMGAPLRVEGPCLARFESDGVLGGFEITGLDAKLTVPMKQLQSLPLEDLTEFNLLRVDGLEQIITSVWAPDGVNENYRVEDAITDKLLSAAVRRGLPLVPNVISRRLRSVSALTSR
jgi:hypothetical protein